ncbi:MAG: NYN domain-containing protein [Actinobacteria bacterium]|nr:NYN domain-containing protein [Actinomycetota bacterium]
MKNKKNKEEVLSKNDRTAVFIDAANLERSVADLGTKLPNIKHLRKDFKWKALPLNYYRVDYKKLYKFFKTNSKLASISFYSARFGTESHDNFLTFLKRNGYRLVTKIIKDIKVSESKHLRKANFDVEISVDAVDWLRNYDTFVLFSGDSDFAYLVRFLKKKGKKILVISERGHVSNELVQEADIYLDLHTFKNDFIVPRTQKSRP